MHDNQQQADVVDDASRLGRGLALTLRWVTPADPDQVRIGGLALLETKRRLVEPFDLRFVVAARDGRLSAGLVVAGLDEAGTERSATATLRLVRACLPWYGFDQPRPVAETPLHEDRLPESAARLTAGTDDDAGVQVIAGGPLSRALVESDATVSCALSTRLVDDQLQSCADALVTSVDAPVDLLAGLLALETNEGNLPRVHIAQGAPARGMAAQHGFGGEASLDDEALARLLSLPSRSQEPATWERLASAPASADEIVEVLRRRADLHRWVIGATGTGKSTLLEHLACADAEDGKAMLVIDPHARLAERLPSLLPRDRADDVICLDFGADDPPSVDLLRPEPGQDRNGLVTEIAELTRQLFEEMPEEHFGAVYHRLLRWALRLVVEGSHRPSIQQVVDVLSGNADLVEDLLQRAGSTSLQRMWHRELKGSLGSPSGTNRGEISVTTYVASKLDVLVSDERLTRIFRPAEERRAQGARNDAANPATPDVRSHFEVTASVRANRVLLVRAPVGTLGKTPVKALATTLLQRAVTAVSAIAAHPGEPPRPLAVYVDEWQNVAQTTVNRLLAEGRKGGLELTVANQSLGQLRRPHDVAANVGALAAFRLGPAEAHLLAPQMPTISDSGLRSLPLHWVATQAHDGTQRTGQTPPPLQASQ